MTASSFTVCIYDMRTQLWACNQSRCDPDLTQDLLHLIVLLTRRPTKPRGRHVRAANCFDLLHAAELWLGQQLFG